MLLIHTLTKSELLEERILDYSSVMLNKPILIWRQWWKCHSWPASKCGLPDLIGSFDARSLAKLTYGFCANGKCMQLFLNPTSILGDYFVAPYNTFHTLYGSHGVIAHWSANVNIKNVIVQLMFTFKHSLASRET